MRSSKRVLFKFLNPKIKSTQANFQREELGMSKNSKEENYSLESNNSLPKEGEGKKINRYATERPTAEVMHLSARSKKKSGQQ